MCLSALHHAVPHSICTTTLHCNSNSLHHHATFTTRCFHLHTVVSHRPAFATPAPHRFSNNQHRCSCNTTRNPHPLQLVWSSITCDCCTPYHGRGCPGKLPLRQPWVSPRPAAYPCPPHFTRKQTFTTARCPPAPPRFTYLGGETSRPLGHQVGRLVRNTLRNGGTTRGLFQLLTSCPSSLPKIWIDHSRRF